MLLSCHTCRNKKRKKKKAWRNTCGIFSQSVLVLFSWQQSAATLKPLTGGDNSVALLETIYCSFRKLRVFEFIQMLLRLIGLHLVAHRAHVSDYGAPQWQQPQRVKDISPISKIPRSKFSWALKSTNCDSSSRVKGRGSPWSTHR